MFDRLVQFFSLSENKDKNQKHKSFFGKCMHNIKELFKKITPHEKAFVITTLSLIIVFGPWMIGYFYMFAESLHNPNMPLFEALSLSPLQYALVGWTLAFPITIIFILIALGLAAVFVIMRSPDLTPVMETDERGVDYSEKGTYGTARWMSRKEAENVFAVGDIHNATGYILGQFTRKGDGTKDCISLPTNSGGNQNYMIIGSPGRGKTFSFGFNAVLQSLVRNESVVVVDPKGELCEKLFPVCEAHGYNTKVYNLVDPKHSNAWNFASEIFNPNTGMLDNSRLTAFVNIVMTNTVEGEKEDSFWGSGEKNLFTAATGYLGWLHEITYAENLRRSAADWENAVLPGITEDDRERMFQIINNENSSIREIELSLQTIMRMSGLATEDEIEQYLLEIKESSDPISIDKIFALLTNNDIDSLVSMFNEANIPASHPAAITWSIFQHGDKKIQPNFIQGLTQRLMLFSNTDINSMSAHDDINFRDLGEKKTAIFCVISASDSSRKLLSSLFFSFLFRDVAEAADELGPENRIPVNVMADEFANIGRIPDFDRFISTVRSRKIYLSIIIQSVAQLAKVYDENDQETIMECCDTILFLGCNGLQTAQFISELSGVASIITSSVKDQKSISGMRSITQGYATSDGAGKRYLVNPDEAMSLDPEEVLIYHAGCQMLKAYRCGFIWHPYAQELPKTVRRLSSYPTVDDMYGRYHNIFEDVSVQSLTEKKAHNEITNRLRMAGIPADNASRPVEKNNTFVPPSLLGDKKNVAEESPKNIDTDKKPLLSPKDNSIDDSDGNSDIKNRSTIPNPEKPSYHNPYIPRNPYENKNFEKKASPQNHHSSYQCVPRKNIHL